MSEIILNKAISMFHKDDNGYYLQGNFLEFDNIFFAHNMKNINDNNLLNAAVLLRNIGHDLWNISAIIDRLEWLRNNYHDNEHIQHRWIIYTGVDIGTFHTEIRSIMDYLALLIAQLTKNNNQLPKSFRIMRERLNKYKNKLPYEIYNLIKNAEWFNDIRGVRDLLVHRGANTLSFIAPNEGILFQIYKDETNKIIDNPIMLFNENVAYFERYSAYYMSHMLVLIEEISSYYRDNIPKIGIGPIRNYAPGWELLLKWMEDLLKIMNTNK